MKTIAEQFADQMGDTREWDSHFNCWGHFWNRIDDATVRTFINNRAGTVTYLFGDDSGLVAMQSGWCTLAEFQGNMEEIA